MNRVKASTLLLFAMCCYNSSVAQTVEERLSALEEKMQDVKKDGKGPQIHGILRGKYEYQPEMSANRFEVRNARMSITGQLPYRSEYKLEVDLCDESAIKMKDAWVRLSLPLNGKNEGEALRVTFGQQRMPFSIDAHRNPSAQYFANRSFIAKQVGDMRDVGAAVGYSPLLTSPGEGKMEMHLDAGIYNGSNLDNQKTAWFTSPAYSARAQFIYTFPRGGKVGAIPSIQHQLIANREANYTSFDFGAYYESPLPSSPLRGGVLHIEAEYLRKHYTHDAFDDCNAVNAMAIYKHKIKNDKTYFDAISYLLRYDYMDNHSDGKKGWTSPNPSPLGLGRFDQAKRLKEGGEKRLVQSDAKRHRLTAGLTFSVRNKYFPTDIRLNYEKYWYPHGGTPKESEQDKLVTEIMIRF